MRDHKKTVLRVQSNWNSLGFFSPIRCDLSISFILYVLTFANQKEAKKQRTEILICPPLSAHLPLGKYVPRFEKFLMQIPVSRKVLRPHKCTSAYIMLC